MAKVALLIGVSEYQPDLQPLPNTVKDVEAMYRVLVDPEIGSFDSAEVLKNPQRQEMEDAIYGLYANRQKEDLLLLYFSGHGVVDTTGEFYLSTHLTRKDGGKLVPTSAVSAKSVHQLMNISRSRRLVIILDCCFSGAFPKGLTTKDGGSVNLEQYLGGEGRAILTASTSTEYAFGQEGLELSVYTHYLVEGMETGVADQDGDGLISVEELHGYAKSKVKEVAPAMTPEFYPFKEGYRIYLAKSPQDDPQLKYRREVERRIHQGEFTKVARRLLNSRRSELNLPPDIADAIEAEVQRPYLEYQRKLGEYETALVEELAGKITLGEISQRDLRDYQQYLGLRDEDVAPIHEQLMGQITQVIPPKDSNPQILLNQFEFDTVSVNAEGTIIQRSRGQGEFVREDLGSGVVLDLVKIPGGEFLMGSPEGEKGRSGDEGPQHQVTIQPFWMGKFPVTQSQWAVVATWPKVKIDLKPEPSRFKGANRPVEKVSWSEAVEFCARLTQRTRKSYRLPSEAEWEYACRAGTTTPFYFGETITTDIANYDGSSTYGSGPKGEYRQQTTDVGIFPANSFGLYDMHGNVREWCADNWHGSYQGAPTDGSAWLDDNDNHYHMLRGGSWLSDPENCRSAYRFSDLFDLADIGFRVACGGSARTE
jgi:formylglycine-generating enzyme required for sulfatase activity/uncharacterized caspase-like protein